MTKTVLFIHSAGPQGPNEGSSGLIEFLEKELSDYHFVHPQMPTPENPSYEPWKRQLEESLVSLTGEVILVGHSLGGSVLLKYLTEESINLTVSGLFMVASPYWGLDDWQSREFILKSNFENDLNHVQHIFLYHSRNEEIVPFSHYQTYAEKLPQANRRELEGYQHLFLKGLPTLVDDLKKL